MKVIKQENLYVSKWLLLNNRVYLDKNNNERNWEYVERKNNINAVVIIPIDKINNKILLIKQYRIPFCNYVIEFPAGLIDKDETVIEAASRELKEETGYTGKIISISPQLSTSAGLTNEIIHIVEVEVNLSSTLNNFQNLEPSEDIEILVINIKDVLDELKRFTEFGYIIDSKVWSYFAR